MTVKHIDDVPLQPVAAGDRTAIQVLIPPEVGPHFAMRRFVMEQGGGMPRHTNTVEHQQFVLRGRATIGIADQVFEVRYGHVVLIPAGVPHWYRAEGNEPFEFLCLVPNLPDEVAILEDAADG